jgi:F0F1-type ATP synthase membrane subunit c/vacuolar-type H+-ATPase subunit K
LDPDLRNALLSIGLIFCGFFAAVTIYVVVDTGLHLRTYGDIGAIALYGVSLGIVGMIAAGLIGALRNPPDD